MSESTYQTIAALPADDARELLALCVQFVNARDELDFQELMPVLEILLQRKHLPYLLEQSLLRTLQEQVEERLIIFGAVSTWAQEIHSQFTLTNIEPSEWRVAVSVNVDQKQQLVYASKAWDLTTEDTIILLNPNRQLPEPLRY
jgi:hypothetical protein